MKRDCNTNRGDDNKTFRGKPKRQKFDDKRRGRPDPIDEHKDKETYVKGHNDLGWLTKNPVMAKVTSRVPFGTPIGYNHNLWVRPSNISTDNVRPYVVPGILAIPSLLTAGIAKDTRSPINQAALGLWVQLRQAGTGSLVDDPNDVAFYYMSIAQLLAMAGWLRRVVGELTAVNVLNRYVRQGLVYAEGLDYDDLVSHYSEFTFFVAWFTAQVNNFVFPKLDYFDQAYTAFHYVYKDENSAKAQCYIVTPAQFGIFRPLYNDQGSGLQYVDFDEDPVSYISPGTGYGFEAIKSFATSMLSVLINDQATATLSAAVLKAYGADNLWRLSDIDILHEEVEIVMDAELLMQFHNIQICPYLQCVASTGTRLLFGYQSLIPESESGISPYVINDPSAVEELSYATTGSIKYSLSPRAYFDAFTETPSEGEVLLMSRLKSIGKYSPVDGSEAFAMQIDSCDAILPVTMYKIVVNAAGDFEARFIPQVEHAIGVSAFRPYISEFQFAPLLFNVGYSDGAQSVVGEIHNFVTVDEQIVRDIHLNNLLSLFNVPIHR